MSDGDVPQSYIKYCEQILGSKAAIGLGVGAIMLIILILVCCCCSSSSAAYYYYNYMRKPTKKK